MSEGNVREGKLLNKNWIIYKDPTFPRADPLVFRPPLPPSAVERLAALEDPEIAARIKKWDDAQGFDLRSFDFVADPSLPKAYPI